MNNAAGRPLPVSDQADTPADSRGRSALQKRQRVSCSQYCSDKFGPGRSDPWLNRKAAVGVLLALSIWSFYVVAGVICVPVIQRRSISTLSAADGAGILVGYVILFLLYGWSYSRMLLTGPGFARDLIPQSDAPGTSFAPIYPGSQTLPPLHAEQPANSNPPRAEGVVPDPHELSPAFNLLQTALHNSSSANEQDSSLTLTSRDPIQAQAGSKRPVPDWRTLERPLPDIQYGPRWCRFCRIVKPDRTHHCRHCGTCIMQFDHHCMWVGQCVGWANHKFFMTFCFWAALYCFYLLIICIIYLTRASDIDGQVIGLIAVSALFGLFTFMMLIQHTYLIVTGKTTLESFGGRDQMEREAKFLNVQFGFWMHQSEKRNVKRKWKEEFGGTNADERWMAGSWKDMWRREMGSSWYEWILPLGRPLGDGMQFPANPRFGPNGEWLKKRDWPKGVA